MIWQTKMRTYDLSEDGLIMGILNVTPDSFSDGGRFTSHENALSHALQMADEGASIIDIGGESTRPGAAAVSVQQELGRVIPIIETLRQRLPDHCAISIDTMKANVAARAIEAGAEIVNDVSGLRGDPDMAGVVADSQAGLIIMHMQGSPRDMQKAPIYRNVLEEVRAFFVESHRLALAAGITSERLVYDPGIGFGKTLEHNLTLLKNISCLQISNRPVLLGVSRKSFIGMILDSSKISERLWPTVAMTSLGREQGVRIFRVHDVRENFEALRMSEAILGRND